MDQFYTLVADVDNYKEFVPWCVKSKVFERSSIHARADLEVGFPPVSEKYTSVLTLAKPNYIKVFIYLFLLVLLVCSVQMIENKLLSFLGAFSRGVNL